MKTIIFEDQERLYRHAADMFAKRSESSIQARGRFVALLPGGSTPLPVFRLLATDPWRSRIQWESVFIGWSDERCVPADHEDSNFRSAQEALLAHISIPESNILRIQGERDPASEAEAYESRLRAFLSPQAGVDLALLGLGSDGHTASLFPGDPAVLEEERWFVPVHIHSLTQPWRITATLPLLNASRSTVFLVTGREKSHALARIRHGDFLPPRLIHPRDADSLWLVDRAATSQSA